MSILAKQCKWAVCALIGKPLMARSIRYRFQTMARIGPKCSMSPMVIGMRHSGGINLNFADGHAAAQGKTELWEYGFKALVINFAYVKK